ncbi:hypothetical protein D3C81_1973890 [compost metagenome]
MHMEAAAPDVDRFTARLNALDRPYARREPQVLDHVAQLFVALGSQLRHLHALLHVGVVWVQRLELQGFTSQGRDDFGKARVFGEQVAIAKIELLALGVVQAQVKRVALGVSFTPL